MRCELTGRGEAGATSMPAMVGRGMGFFAHAQLVQKSGDIGASRFRAILTFGVTQWVSRSARITISAAILLTAVWSPLILTSARAMDQPSNPTSERIIVSSDRMSLDIGVVGSTSVARHGGWLFQRALNGQGLANNPVYEGAAMSSQARGPRDGASSDCISRLRTFIDKLDMLLSGNAPTVYPVLDLLKEYFPLVSCDIEQALETSRKSKFFSNISEDPKYYVIVFDSKGYSFWYPGFYVSFGLDKESGNSSLPFAKVNDL